MLFRPSPSYLRYAIALFAFLALGLAVWLWTLLAARAGRVEFDAGVSLLGLALFLSFALVGMLGYWAWCIATMRYRLDESALQIWVGGVRHTVPLKSVLAVYPPGASVNGEPIEVLWKRANPPLPGYVVGAGISMQLGNALSVATLPVSQQVFISTPGLAFGVSPRDPDAFVAQVKSKLEPEKPHDELEGHNIVSPPRPRTALFGWSAWGAPLWDDRLARGLFLGGLVVCALLFAYLGAFYPGLPPNLPIHWDAQAQPDVIGGPIELLRLPAFALSIWLVNAVAARLVLSRERAATLFLLAGGLIVQIVFAAAVLSIVLKAV